MNLYMYEYGHEWDCYYVATGCKSLIGNASLTVSAILTTVSAPLNAMKFLLSYAPSPLPNVQVISFRSQHGQNTLICPGSQLQV